MNETRTANELYFVRIPNGQEFGPADRSTILTWESQGRVNDTCHVRLQSSNQLVSFAQWKQNEPPAASNQASPATTSRYANANVFGDQIGRVDVPRNQSTTVPRSRANGVLILGICSWFLCLSFIGAPICALFAIGLGVVELGRINRGEVGPEQTHLVWIGIALGGVNLVFVSIFVLYGLIATILA